MRVHDRLAERDVVDAVRGGGSWRAPGGRAFVEVDQLLLEALFEGGDLLASRGARRAGSARFRYQHRRRASQEGGRKRKREAPVGRIERELHLVPRDPGEVDPRQDALGRAVREYRSQPGLADIRELEPVRLAHDTAHRIELVHEAVEKNGAIRPTRERVGVADRRRDPRLVVPGEGLGEIGYRRTAAMEVVVLDIW